MLYTKSGKDIIVRLEIGEEICTSILELLKKEKITCASISGLGACDDVAVGIYNLEEKKYYKNEFHEPMELSSLVGNASMMNGEPYLHLHANFGRADGTVIGGHLNHAIIMCTAEIFIHVIDVYLDRFHDDENGLNLFKL